MEEHAAGSGVKVTNVCPGSVRTNVSRSALVGRATSFGTTDPNIADGMSVEYAVDRILAGN
jgi:short-subunit dehydrogenase